MREILILKLWVEKNQMKGCSYWKKDGYWWIDVLYLKGRFFNLKLVLEKVEKMNLGFFRRFKS